MRKGIFLLPAFFLAIIFIASKAFAQDNETYKIKYQFNSPGNIGGINNTGQVVSAYWGVHSVNDLGADEAWSEIRERYLLEPDREVEVWTAYVWDAQNGIKNISAEEAGFPVNTRIAINDSGLATGNLPFQCFVWDRNNGKKDIFAADSGNSINDINNNGFVTGEFFVPDDGEHAFIWDADNGFRDIGKISGARINDLGTVSGSLDGRALTWDENEGIKAIGEFTPVDISNTQEIVGFAGEFPDVYAVIWDEDSGLRKIEPVSALDGFDSSFGSATAINNLGTAAGGYKWFYFDEDGNLKNDGYAFLWDKDTGTKDINKLIINKGDYLSDGREYVFLSALDINDGGQILAAGYPEGVDPESFDGFLSGSLFLLDPVVVPEPLSAFLFGLGIATLALSTRRRFT